VNPENGGQESRRRSGCRRLLNTIRGGGDPYSPLAFKAVPENGPAAPELRRRCAWLQPNTTVWAPGTGPSPPKKWSGRGRPPKLIRRDAKHRPSSVKALALDLPKRAWRTIEWREGTAERLSSRFALVRVRVAHRDYQLTDNRPEQWLLIEWPEGEKGPTKYWLSTLPEGITFRRLVDFAKLRWRIERDYQEL
jgi:SRSO17 transposase